MVGFGFWLEITGEKRQTCHFCRNRRLVPVLKVVFGPEDIEYRYSKLFLVHRILSTGTES